MTEIKVKTVVRIPIPLIWLQTDNFEAKYTREGNLRVSRIGSRYLFIDEESEIEELATLIDVLKKRIKAVEGLK